MTIVIDIPRSYRSDAPSQLRHDYGGPHNSSVQLEANEVFLDAVLGHPARVHYSSRTKLYVAHLDERAHYGDRVWNHAAYNAPTISLAVQAAHQCFAAHVPLELRPDTVWYMILHQLAEHVGQHAGDYATLFTRTPGEKQEIKVRDDSLRYDAPSDWGRAIRLFRDPLDAIIGDRAVEQFLPRFSTTTVEDETAALVAFMDLVSPYYKYTVQSMCHIPQVRLEGTAADWQELYRRTEGLAGTFGPLSGYFADLLPVLQTIAETAGGAHPDDEFWQSLYKYRETSGGEYVSGWITALFAYEYNEDGPKLKESFDWRGLSRGWGGYLTNQFPSHVSSVPFQWEYFGQVIPMTFAAGILGVDHTDGFLSPRLGFAVAEPAQR